MKQEFTLYFQRGRGTVAAVAGEGDGTVQSKEYTIRQICFFRHEGKEIVELTSAAPHVVVNSHESKTVHFFIEQPKFICRHKTTAVSKSEKAFVLMNGSDNILYLDADTVQLSDHDYVMCGEEVDVQAPFRPINRYIATIWTCGLLGISFDSLATMDGTTKWMQQKDKYDNAVQKLMRAETEDDYATAMVAVADAHHQLVEVCEFWSKYTVEDYLKEQRERNAQKGSSLRSNEHK